MKKRKSLLSIAMMLCMFAGVQGANAQDVSNWSELTNAIQNATTPININNNITNDGTTGLGTLGGSDNTVTINGNMYDINGSSLGGITVNSGQTLNINNVGTNDSLGFNGFNSGSNGGAIYTGGTVNITDSTFSNNTAGDSGGAIFNYSGTANIIADKADTIFTSNTANNISNALYQSRATTNLNASESANIIFNDGIDGNIDYISSNIININNTGVKMADGTDAPTTGVIEFNNEVKNNTVNMYNGVLKFGTNTQNDINYSGTFADSVNFNYRGGILTLQDGGRNGVGLQAGFRWTLGKTQPTVKKASGNIPELPKTQVTLNNIR